MFKLILSITFLFTFVSCVSNQIASDHHCANIDWQNRGKLDAYKGKPKSAFGELRQSCEIYGFKANRKAYIKGYVSGENTFCSERGGWFYGSTGKKYEFDCPEESEPDFLLGYKEGRADFMRDKIFDKLDKIGDNKSSSEEEKALGL